MTRLGWRVIELAAHGLDSAERDAVLGDVVECGAGFGAALRDLLGLVVRRQGGLWTAWQPWIALIGIGGVAGTVLSRIVFRFDAGLGQQLMAYRKYGVPFETGLTVREDVTFLAVLAIALTVWSWVCGFALGSLSGRAAWLVWLVFYLVVLNSAWARSVFAGNLILRNPRVLPLMIGLVMPHGIAGVLFLIPGVFGTRFGARRRFLSLRGACVVGLLAMVLAILLTWMSGRYETAHEIWSGGVWRGASWPTLLLPFLLASWPAVYVFARSFRQRPKEIIYES